MECGVKKIVFSSLATVYGDPEYLPLDENHPTGKCTNPYGKTKYFMEEIMKDVCTAHDVCMKHCRLCGISYVMCSYLRTGVVCCSVISIPLVRIRPEKLAKILRESRTI